MNISDLFEATLPLIPREIPRIRGSYGAFIITMHPEDFLKLTASPGDRAQIEQQPFPMPKDEMHDPEQDGRFPMPFLTVEWPSGQITGHEGRHRALMVKRQGGANFPVAIYLRWPTQYAVTYCREDEATGEYTNEHQIFDDREAAEDFVGKLKRQEDAGVYYWKARISSEHRDVIKGSPRFNDPADPWKKKPFSAADMPAQLCAEYNPAITVSDFKIGLVKGYRHFR